MFPYFILLKMLFREGISQNHLGQIVIFLEHWLLYVPWEADSDGYYMQDFIRDRQLWKGSGEKEREKEKGEERKEKMGVRMTERGEGEQRAR